MGGTLEGGRAAAATNKKRYGDSFYRNIGRKGGAKKGVKGFALNRELASKAGQIGGRKSTRSRKETE